MLQYPAKPMISSVVMQPHLHLRAGYQSYRDRINNFMSEYQGPVECGMTGTYRGRSRHRLPRREGARSAGRTGGAPQYVPAQKCSAKYGNAPNHPDMPSITRKCLEVHNIAPKCLEMLAIANAPNRPDVLNITRKPRHRTRTTPAPHRKSSPDLDDVCIFS